MLPSDQPFPRPNSHPLGVLDLEMALETGTTNSYNKEVWTKLWNLWKVLYPTSGGQPPCRFLETQGMRIWGMGKG